MPCCGFDLLIFPSIYLCNMNARKEFLNTNKLGIWSRLWFDSKAGGENRKIDRSPADILRINSYDRQSTKKKIRNVKKKTKLGSIRSLWSDSTINQFFTHYSRVIFRKKWFHFQLSSILFSDQHWIVISRRIWQNCKEMLRK